MKVVVINRILDDQYADAQQEIVMITSGTLQYAESLFRELEIKRRAEAEAEWKVSDKHVRVPYRIIREQKYVYWAEEHELQNSSE